MILLAAAADNMPTWNIPHLSEINQIAQILGTIFVLIYVFYTVLTFKQIKKQTDYQQDAYLKVSHFKYPELPKEDSLSTWNAIGGGSIIRVSDYVNKDYIIQDFPDKIKTALKRIYKSSLPDNIYEGNYLTLIFHNYGNAVIDSINITVRITVQYNQEVAIANTLQRGDIVEEKVIKIPVILGNQAELRVALISTAAFPTYSISISGTYRDVKDKIYPIPQLIVSDQNQQFHKVPSE